MISRKLVLALWIVLLGVAQAPVVAKESAWRLEISDLHGADGVMEIYNLSPDQLLITLRDDQTVHEVARRPLTRAEQKIVEEAISRFSKAGLKPRYEDPTFSDGCAITVEFAAAGGRAGRVEVQNVIVPELEALTRSLAPLLPPTAALNHYPADYLQRKPAS